MAKDFENAAVIAPMTKAADFGPIGHQRITLHVNGLAPVELTPGEGK